MRGRSSDESAAGDVGDECLCGGGRDCLTANKPSRFFISLAVRNSKIFLW